MTSSKKTVVVGMSGGVDSSVAAALLKEQGYNVIGLFMKNWDEQDENGVCNASKEYADVVKVCERLDIPYYSVEFVKEYWENVFLHFVEEYKKGLTPNPDILCNREIKFKVFYDQAMKMGGDFLATGHYCKVGKDANGPALLKGEDNNKDQSYFLYTIKSHILEKVLFPVGDIPKSRVREIANDLDLSTKNKKDSTGICFIGERNFTNFLANYVEAKPGRFQNLDGTDIGEHRGVAFYTLGQRKGLGLGGPGEAWYVVAKDIPNNIVFVERGAKHPAMYCDYLIADDLTWVGEEVSSFPYKCFAKNRYRQTDQACTIHLEGQNKLRVEFDIPQRAISPGQSIVFYEGNRCLGGAIIQAPGPSYFEQGRKLPDLIGS